MKPRQREKPNLIFQGFEGKRTTFRMMKMLQLSASFKLTTFEVIQKENARKTICTTFDFRCSFSWCQTPTLHNVLAFILAHVRSLADFCKARGSSSSQCFFRRHIILQDWVAAVQVLWGEGLFKDSTQIHRTCGL